jgi:hypothetical protein
LLLYAAGRNGGLEKRLRTLPVYLRRKGLFCSAEFFIDDA